MATITIFNARANAMNNESAISREHTTNNEGVRNTLPERSIRPATLSPVEVEEVKKVERRLASEEGKTLKRPRTLVKSLISSAR